MIHCYALSARRPGDDFPQGVVRALKARGFRAHRGGAAAGTLADFGVWRVDGALWLVSSPSRQAPWPALARTLSTALRSPFEVIEVEVDERPVDGDDETMFRTRHKAWLQRPDGTRGPMRPVVDPLDEEQDCRGDAYETAGALLMEAVSFNGSHRIADWEEVGPRISMSRLPLPLSPALSAAFDAVELAGSWKLVDLSGQQMIAVPLPDGGRSLTAATDDELVRFASLVGA